MTSSDEASGKPGLSQEALLRAATRIAMIATDLDGRITTWNTGAERMLGYAATEMVGKPSSAVLQLHLASELAVRGRALSAELDAPIDGFEVVVALARRGGCDERDWTYVRKDGARLSVRVAVTAVYDAAGAVVGFLAAAVDLTERKQADEALRRSEANLHAMLANTADLIASYDRSRRLVAYNQASSEAFRRMLGKDPGPGSRIVDLVPEAIRKFWDTNSERALAGESFTIEFEMPAPGGGQCAMESSYHPVRQGTAIVGFMTTTRDITQRKRAEEELRAREKQWRTMFDFAPYACAVADMEGRCLTINQAFGEVWGLTAADVVGRTTDEVGIVVASEAKAKIAAALARTGAVRMLEADISHRGDTSTFSISIRPIELAGKPARLVVAVDISDKKRAERVLRQSEERFRLLLQNSNDLLMIIDEQGRPLSVNGASQAVVGYAPEEMLGVSGVGAIHPDDVDAVMRVHAKTLAEPGRKQRIEYRTRRKDGSWIWIEAIGNNLFADPSVKGIVINIRDITARKLAEAEREKLQAQLLQAQKMESVGRLAGGVAHDFNNMLGVIQGHVDLALENVELPRSLREDLEEIRKAAGRSADLTRQLLAFARKQTIAPKVLDINQTVDGMLKMLRRLIGEDIELVWLPGRDADLVRMDPSQMDQILANLAVNARDAISGTGRLSIETSRVALDESYCADHVGLAPGEYVLLAVSDDGCGMDAETRSHLFEPFFTTKERGKGTGLGLATVFGIVRQNDGFINVYSEPGQGTTFKVYLPRHRSAGAQVQQVGAMSTAGGSETVLLVEDEPSIRQVTERMLRRLGYSVITASTPGEAIHLGREHVGEIDLLLTDVVMPEMNGRDLAENLLSIRAGLKCLFVSGYTANAIAHHGVLDEGLHFLQKPFSIEALAAKVREVLATG